MTALESAGLPPVQPGAIQFLHIPAGMALAWGTCKYARKRLDWPWAGIASPGQPAVGLMAGIWKARSWNKKG